MTHAVTPTPSNGANQTDTSQLSDQQIRALLFQVMQLVQIALSEISKANGQNQADQTTIANAIAKTTHEKTVDYEKKYQQMLDEEAEAHSGFMGILSDIFGNTIISSILTALVGALLVETGVGMALLATTVALQASGKLDTITNAISTPFTDLFKEMGMGDEAAQFLGGLCGTAVLTGASGIAEGVELNVVRTTDKVAASTVENEAQSAASNGAKEYGMFGKYYHGGFATAQMFTSSLSSLNPVYHLIKACGGSDQAATIASAIINIVIALAAFKAAAGGAALPSPTQMLKNLSEKLPKVVYTFQGTAQAGQSGYNIGNGIIQIKTGEILKDLGPIEGVLTALKGLTTVNNSMFALSQQTLKQAISSFETAFNIDLSLDWKAASQATIEIAG